MKVLLLPHAGAVGYIPAFGEEFSARQGTSEGRLKSTAMFAITQGLNCYQSDLMEEYGYFVKQMPGFLRAAELTIEGIIYYLEVRKEQYVFPSEIKANE